MTFYKPIQHDLRCGLLRAEYWLAVFVTSISLLQYFRLLSLHSISGTLGGCLLYLFRGEQAISSLSSGNQKTEIPILWILLIVTCPALHIRYFLDGLTINGQQIMIRCQSRKHWILSKMRLGNGWGLFILSNDTDLCCNILYHNESSTFPLYDSLYCGGYPEYRHRFCETSVL